MISVERLVGLIFTCVGLILIHFFQGAKNMKCLICAGTELVRDTRDIPYTYKSKSTIIPAVTGDFCPACGEVILEKSEAVRTSALMREFNRCQTA